MIKDTWQECAVKCENWTIKDNQPLQPCAMWTWRASVPSNIASNVASNVASNTANTSKAHSPHSPHSPPSTSSSTTPSTPSTLSTSSSPPYPELKLHTCLLAQSQARVVTRYEDYNEMKRRRDKETKRLLLRLLLLSFLFLHPLFHFSFLLLPSNFLLLTSYFLLLTS